MGNSHCLTTQSEVKKDSINTVSPPTSTPQRISPQISESNTMASTGKDVSSKATVIDRNSSNEPNTNISNTNISIKSHGHYKNMQSLNSIDECSAIALHEMQGESDEDRAGPMLTHEALREHDMNIAMMGMDSASLSLSSVSVTETDVGEDRLKQIGNQLLSMKIKHISPEYKNKQKENRIEKERERNIKDTNNSLQIPANGRYKQYKLRQCAYKQRKTGRSPSNTRTSYSRYGSSTSLSTTPVPNDYNIDLDSCSDAADRYYKLSSRVNKDRYRENGHYTRRQNGNMLPNTNRSREIKSRDMMSSDDEETDDETINFPDVLYFRKHDTQQLN